MDIEKHYALLTDLYELTMAQGYFLQEMQAPAVFDMFFRRMPFKGGYVVFAGLGDLLRMIENMKFTGEDIDYLASLKLFNTRFLDYLSTFRFKGEIYACDEGTAVFASEPLIRVQGTMIEAQLLESFLLNCINYQTLIATKAARIFLASGKGVVLEFGLRKAHGSNGALSAARAAFIGGAAATSNTLAGKLLNIPVKGTMAHSWVLAFPTESGAFEIFAGIYPDNCILLVDTYNTLSSGIKNAIQVCTRLKKDGYTDFGVRLDSGNLYNLSCRVRKILDRAGLEQARIIVSNEMDEYAISRLVKKHAPVDVWGVGTNLVTGHPESALSGVYKLAALQTGGRWKTVYKTSDDKQKQNLPGIKQLYRFTHNGKPVCDVIGLTDNPPASFYSRGKQVKLPAYTDCHPLLTLKMKKGLHTEVPLDIKAIRQHALDNLNKLPAQYQKLKNPAAYPVYIAGELQGIINNR